MLLVGPPLIRASQSRQERKPWGREDMKPNELWRKICKNATQTKAGAVYALAACIQGLVRPFFTCQSSLFAHASYAWKRAESQEGRRCYCSVSQDLRLKLNRYCIIKHMQAWLLLVCSEGTTAVKTGKSSLRCFNQAESEEGEVQTAPRVTGKLADRTGAPLRRSFALPSADAHKSLGLFLTCTCQFYNHQPPLSMLNTPTVSVILSRTSWHVLVALSPQTEYRTRCIDTNSTLM